MGTWVFENLYDLQSIWCLAEKKIQKIFMCFGDYICHFLGKGGKKIWSNDSKKKIMQEKSQQIKKFKNHL